MLPIASTGKWHQAPCHNCQSLVAIRLSSDLSRNQSNHTIRCFGDRQRYPRIDLEVWFFNDPLIGYAKPAY